MRTATREVKRMEELASAVGARAQNYLDAGVETLSAARDKALEFGHGTDKYVHSNPWLAIGAAAGAGLVTGFLLRGLLVAPR